MRRSLKQVGVKQSYNPVLQEVRVSWRSEFGVSCCSLKQWEPDPAESWVEQPRRLRKKCCYSRKSWGSICCNFCSVSNSPLIHNPFVTILNKVWEVYLSKEVCLLVFIVLTMFLHAYKYVTCQPLWFIYCQSYPCRKTVMIWYDSTWDWTQVSWSIGKHSNQ